MAVVVADDPKLGAEAASFLIDLGFTNVNTYLEGLDKWKAVIGEFEYPKGISFEVKLLFWPIFIESYRTLTQDITWMGNKGGGCSAVVEHLPEEQKYRRSHCNLTKSRTLLLAL